MGLSLNLHIHDPDDVKSVWHHHYPEDEETHEFWSAHVLGVRLTIHRRNTAVALRQELQKWLDTLPQEDDVPAVLSPSRWGEVPL
jgi:hypothetical protein